MNVEVGVDEELLEESELAAEGAERDLRGRHPSHLSGLLLELRPARAGEVDGRAAVTRRGRINLLREVGGEACRRESTEHANAEPVEDVVLEAAGNEGRALVLVEEREATTNGKLGATFAVETELAHRRCAGERARDLDLLRVRSLRSGDDAGRECSCRQSELEALLHGSSLVPVRGDHLGNLYSQLNGKNMLMPIWAWTLLVRGFSPNHVLRSCCPACVAATCVFSSCSM